MSAGARRALTLIVVVAAGFLAYGMGHGRGGAESGHQGFASLLPALTALALVFITRQVVIALFAGIVVGGLVVGTPNILDAFILPAIGSESYAVILVVYLWCLGGLIGLWTRTGGARHFAEWAAHRFVRGPRSAKLFAWLLGVLFHQGGTISTVLAGTTVRPVSDAQRVSHEELAYVVDSTASPVATLIPLNAWPLYIAGLVVGTAPPLATEELAVSFFFRSIPLNLYAIVALTFTLLLSLEVLPWWGKRMRAAARRARETGALDRPGAVTLSAAELTEVHVAQGYRPSLWDFCVPLGTLLLVALSGLVPWLRSGELSDISVPIAQAFGLALLAGVVTALLRGLSLLDAVDGVVDGIKGVTLGALVLGLAVTLAKVSGALGTAGYVTEQLVGNVPMVALPVMLLVLNMAVAFAIGSSWGTFAVVFPVAMPLAWAIHPDPFYLSLCFSSVVSGAVFGDQCSPVSDTTVLSSLACGADLMDHVLTQLPLACAAAGIAALGYTFLAFVAG